MKLTQERDEVLDSRLNRLLFDHRPPLPRMLYHYTTATGLLGILDQHKLWATHYAYLNDPSEFEYGRKLISDVLRGKREAALQHPDVKGANRWVQFCAVAELAVQIARGQMLDHFLACFCEEGDLLSQWRGYGSLGGGYSLGFPPQTLDSLKPLGISLVAIRYDRGDQMRVVSEILDAVFEQIGPSFEAYEDWSSVTQPFVNALAPHLIDCLCCFKNPAFQEEREWRCIFPVGIASLLWDPNDYLCFRPGSHGIIPYVQMALSEDRSLPIAEIIAGPGLDGSLAEKALSLLAQKCNVRVQVRRSQFLLRG
jgi:hypothetical protein